MLILSSMLIFASYLLGQVSDNNPLQSLNLASITGVVGATMFIVEILKRIFKGKAFFEKIPVFVYAGLIAVALAFTAHAIKTSDGSPILAGSTMNVLWASLIAALGSSGFYTWLRSPQTVADSSTLTSPSNIVPMLVIFAVPMMLLTGCSADKIALREGLANTSSSMWSDHIDWATKLTVDPTTGKDQRDQLPKLSQNDLASVKAAKTQYDGILADDRAKDGKVLGIFGSSPTTLPSK